MSFLQGNPRPPSLSLQEGSSRPSDLLVGGNPRPSWRLCGASAQHSWESLPRSGLPAPVRCGPGQGDAVGWRLRGLRGSGARDCASCGCGSTTALQLRAGAAAAAPAAAAPAAAAPAAAAARGLAGRRLGPNAQEAAGAPTSRVQVKRPSMQPGRGDSDGGGVAPTTPRAPGKVYRQIRVRESQPRRGGDWGCRSCVPRFAAQTPLVSCRGRGGRRGR